MIFVNILKFISPPIFEIKIYEKIPWHQKKAFSPYRQSKQYLTPPA